MEICSTFFIIGLFWKMLDGSLDQFGSDITTFVKIHFAHINSKSLFIQILFILILLLTIYFKKLTYIQHSPLLVHIMIIMQEGSLDQFGSDITAYIKSTSLISTLNLCLFFLPNSSSDISCLQELRS